MEIAVMKGSRAPHKIEHFRGGFTPYYPEGVGLVG